MALEELEALSAAVPALNQKAAQQQQAAQRIQARAAVAKAPNTMNSGQLSQSVAAPLALQQGQIATTAAANTQQQQLGFAEQMGQEESFGRQLSLQRTEQTNQQDITNRTRAQESTIAADEMTVERSLTRKELSQQQELAKYGIDQDNRILQLTIDQRKTLRLLGNNLEDELIDSRRRFESDERGRKFSNERQLADFALSNSASEVEFTSKLKDINAAHQKKILFLEGLHEKLTDTLRSESAMAEARLDAEQRKRLSKIASETNKELARAKAKSEATKSILAGAFGIGGAIIGGIAGSVIPGAGTAAGASLGMAIGTGFGQIAAGSQQA